jgi:RNA polymerase I-specific transcription initiation factor RRN3
VCCSVLRFYAVAQATFLIFCFRWREFLLEDAVEGEEDEDEEAMTWGNAQSTPANKWIPELDVIQRVILSPLNPLKVSCRVCKGLMTDHVLI